MAGCEGVRGLVLCVRAGACASGADGCVGGGWMSACG